MLSKFACAVSDYAGKPFAFTLAFAIVLGWGVTGPLFGFSEPWQIFINTLTTIITFLMMFLLQHTQNRDNAALHAKLDEIIRAGEARNEFIGLDDKPKDEIDRKRGKPE